jgi:hypothetical protein
VNALTDDGQLEPLLGTAILNGVRVTLEPVGDEVPARDALARGPGPPEGAENQRDRAAERP